MFGFLKSNLIIIIFIVFNVRTLFCPTPENVFFNIYIRCRFQEFPLTPAGSRATCWEPLDQLIIIHFWSFLFLSNYHFAADLTCWFFGFTLVLVLLSISWNHHHHHHHHRELRLKTKDFIFCHQVFSLPAKTKLYF